MVGLGGTAVVVVVFALSGCGSSSPNTTPSTSSSGSADTSLSSECLTWITETRSYFSDYARYHDQAHNPIETEVIRGISGTDPAYPPAGVTISPSGAPNDLTWVNGTYPLGSSIPCEWLQISVPASGGDVTLSGG